MRIMSNRQKASSRGLGLQRCWNVRPENGEVDTGSKQRHAQDLRKQRENKIQELLCFAAGRSGHTDCKMNLLSPLLLLVTSCAASPQDLSGKMFLFPQESNTAYVKLTTSIQDFSSLTVCHRSFTDLKRDHALFSFSTSFNPNGVLVFWDNANKELEPHVKDQKTEYSGLDYKPNMWHSICTTWDSTSGLVQMWFDGQPMVRKFSTTGPNIRGNPIIIIGQEQDSHGGGFDAKQSFVGMMSDIHMWDNVLSPCQIHKYMDELDFTPGNVLNWSALEFQKYQNVLIDDKLNMCF
ncbi:serum amyloid P-component-like [Nelusetta ayraudi]|uniref:serum amyloid P-component-like n=1 Tax=Nelusetta ayraudi TaxID=303726 RepID=UPI003F717D96